MSCLTAIKMTGMIFRVCTHAVSAARFERRCGTGEEFSWCFMFSEQNFCIAGYWKATGFS